MDLQKYLIKEYIIGTAQKIHVPQGALDIIVSLMPKLDVDEANCIYELMSNSLTIGESFERLKKLSEENEHGDLMCVLIYLAASGYTHEKYKELGISDKIFYDTMDCLSEKIITHRNLYGTWGYKPIYWPSNHINCSLFKCERLGFEMRKNLGEDITHNGKPIIKHGDDYLAVHISDNEKLTHDLCQKSYQVARKFFNTYFPEFKPQYFHCGTWLLDPELKALLPENSNIAKFQADFTIYNAKTDNAEVLFRLFGKADDNLDSYPKDTSLRRNVIEHFKAGKNLGRGFGYIKF